jgi:hypothetical protein
MGRDFHSSKLDSESGIFDVEDALISAMRPVIPRQEFIKDMRRRVVSYSEPGSVMLEDRSLPFTLWILAGIASGVVLLLIGIRSMVTLSRSEDRSRST